jgi:hypothetical protein
LDIKKVNIIQLLYRTALILELSISNIVENFDLSEIKMNEIEIDRLYRLITKTIALSLIDSNVLQSSNIHNTSLIPHIFLISKRFENIADNILFMGLDIEEDGLSTDELSEVLIFVKEETDRSIRHIIGKSAKLFEKMSMQQLNQIRKKIGKLSNRNMRNHLYDIVRYLHDIEEEIVNITFYKKLIQDNVL